MAAGGFFILILFLAYIGYKSIKIVYPYEKGVVERLGKFQRIVDSGITVLIPFIDRMEKVDMRERVIDVPPQQVITKDNVVVVVDCVVYYQVTDPYKVLYNVTRFNVASTKLAQTNLRNVVGELTLDDTFTSREKINAQLRQILDEATDKWGVRINRVEIQKIDPPPDITEAMHKQVNAEREKRAAILDAEGLKRSAILTAEGEKQAVIEKAVGEAQAIREVAQAERDKYIYEAEGKAQALSYVFSAIRQSNIDKNILSIQYLDMLKTSLANNDKFVVLPVEFTRLIKDLSTEGATGLKMDKTMG